MLYYQLRGMLCGGDFAVSLKRKNTRASSFYRCFSILRSRKCGIIHTRFHTIMWLRKTGMLNIFTDFSHSCVMAMLSDLLVDERKE